jgi:D-serine deaminase-like pyridoxal phosphate-dependent protein
MRTTCETPALLLDLQVVKNNMKRMLDFLDGKGLALRPHSKVFRATPELALMLSEAGAIGITCAKVSEAEVLFRTGIKDILIANEVVGEQKIERLVTLAKDANIIIAVDNSSNAKNISTTAMNAGVTIGVLVEINIGHNRCGVAPFDPVLALARQIHRLPGLMFMGIMGYDGHCTLGVDAQQRRTLSVQANKILVDNHNYLEDNGVKVQIVSGSGTFTYRYAAEVDGLTEIQAGTFLLMDTEFKSHGVHEFDCALSVLTTVISRPTYPGSANMVVTDIGRKSISTAYGEPVVKSPPGAEVMRVSDEHTRVKVKKGLRVPDVGEQLEFWVRDANGTINLFDKFYVIENQSIVDIWKIPLCGIHT